MGKILPVQKIDGVPYLVDVDYGVLRQQADPERVIEFDQLEDRGTHYHLVRAGSEPMVIPYMVKLDPEGIARKYEIPVIALPQTDGELRCNEALLADRLGGKLPTIELVGHPFFVDLRLDLLRPKDDFITSGIRLSSLSMDRSGTAFQFLYNADKHTAVSYEESWQKIPRGVMALQIPNEAILDPVGALLKHTHVLRDKYPFAHRAEGVAFDWEPTGWRQFIDRYPVRYDLKARVIPWERTLIPELIARHRKGNTQKINWQKQKKTRGRRL